MVEITLPIVLQLVQTIALIVGIAYYLFIMRNSQRNQQIQIETRQAQLFMQIFTHQYDIDQRRSLHLLNTLEYEDYDDYISKYGPDNNPDAYFRIGSLGTYFEGVGVLVKRKLVDPTIVDDLMSGRIIDFWEKQRSFALAYRERTGDYEMGVFSPVHNHPEEAVILASTASPS